MTAPAPSGPVTIATVCHFFELIGNEDRNVRCGRLGHQGP